MSDAFRRSLPTLSRLVLAAVLFAQLILTAQACLTNASNVLVAMVATDSQVMHNASMNMAQDSSAGDCQTHQKVPPTTCMAHFSFAHQTLDVPHLPVIAFIAAFFLFLPLLRRLSIQMAGWRAFRRVRNTDPPLSIRFCSFQN